MSLEDLGNIGEFVAAVAVLVSLIYLATQIRDNTRSLQAASLQSVLDGQRDHSFLPLAQSAEITELYARGLNGLDNLDEGERRRFLPLLLDQCFQMQNVMQLHERNLLSDADYDAWLKYTTSLFRTPGGAAVWPDLQRVLTPTIRDCISDSLKGNPDQPSFLQLMPLFRRGGSGSEEST